MSKSKHLLWGGDPSWAYGTMPKSLWMHFLLEPRIQLTCCF